MIGFSPNGNGETGALRGVFAIAPTLSASTSDLTKNWPKFPLHLAASIAATKAVVRSMM
jgi:hypothetical protein